MPWLLHVLGVDDLSGRWYGLWSGFGSDLGEFAIVGGLLGVCRRHNCSVHGCWRVGRHRAGDHMVCRRHHPRGAPSHADVIQAHEAGKDSA
jgi:hypothetical protein